MIIRLLLIFTILLLSACSAAPQAVAAITGEQQVTTVATQTSSQQQDSDTVTTEPLPPAALPPLVSPRGSTPADFPSFAPSRPEDIVTPSPEPSQTTAPAQPPVDEANTEQSHDGTPAVAGTSGTPPITPTPPPTFTPPATPDESSDEHYWLQRPVAAGGVVWTDKYYPYGSTRGGELRPHHGVEFNVPYNTEILAAAAGTVRVAGSDTETAYGPQTNFYGNLVVVQHDFQLAGQPIFTLYGHLNEVMVGEGQPVSAQEMLGLSGATGVAGGPHLHFEVRVGANSYDNTRNPLLWLFPFPERGTIAGRVLWPDGSPATGAPVSLNRIDGASPYYATTTYAGDSVNADDFWQENFALDDVVVGYYEVVVRVGEDKYTAETWVYPYRTSFIEIVLEPSD